MQDIVLRTHNTKEQMSKILGNNNIVKRTARSSPVVSMVLIPWQQERKARVGFLLVANGSLKSRTSFLHRISEI